MSREDTHTAESDLSRKNIEFFIEMYRLYEPALVEYGILEKAQQFDGVEELEDHPLATGSAVSQPSQNYS